MDEWIVSVIRAMYKAEWKRKQCFKCEGGSASGIGFQSTIVHHRVGGFV